MIDDQNIFDQRLQVSSMMDRSRPRALASKRLNVASPLAIPPPPLLLLLLLLRHLVLGGAGHLPPLLHHHHHPREERHSTMPRLAAKIVTNTH